MKVASFFRTAAVVLATIGLVLPAHAASPLPKAPAVAQGNDLAPAAVQDVSLGDGGLLLGQAVDAGGAPLAGIPVALVQDGCLLADSRTAADGSFAFRGLRGGVHQLQVGGEGVICRCWMPGTAPPVAAKGLLVIAETDVIRGQMCPPPLLNGIEKLKYWMTEPLVVGGIIVTAVAIPVIAHNRNQNRRTGS